MTDETFKRVLEELNERVARLSREIKNLQCSIESDSSAEGREHPLSHPSDHSEADTQTDT